MSSERKVGFSKWGLCATLDAIQILVEAILACHLARSTEWLVCHPKSCTRTCPFRAVLEEGVATLNSARQTSYGQHRQKLNPDISKSADKLAKWTRGREPLLLVVHYLTGRPKLNRAWPSLKRVELSSFTPRPKLKALLSSWQEKTFSSSFVLDSVARKETNKQTKKKERKKTNIQSPRRVYSQTWTIPGKRMNAVALSQCFTLQNALDNVM